MWFNPITFTASYTMTFLNTKVARAVIKQAPTPTFSDYSEFFHLKWTYQLIVAQKQLGDFIQHAQPLQ